MNSRKKKLLAIIIGGALFVAWRVHGYMQRYATTPASASANVIQIQEPVMDAGQQIQPASREDLVALLEMQRQVEKQPWGRDPFDSTPFNGTVASKPKTQMEKHDKPKPASPILKFSGVSKAGDRWLAAVNGGIVRVGDVVQEKYKVVQITNSSITLVSEDWAFRFGLGETHAEVNPWTEKP